MLRCELKTTERIQLKPRYINSSSCLSITINIDVLKKINNNLCVLFVILLPYDIEDMGVILQRWIINEITREKQLYGYKM